MRRGREGQQMSGRIRIAAVGLVAVTLLCAVSSNAGAQNTASNGMHTGEYWPGTAPVFVLAGTSLAGLLLIGRRRIVSLVRSFSSSNRRRGGP
jgi:hypothetical protein